MKMLLLALAAAVLIQTPAYAQPANPGQFVAGGAGFNKYTGPKASGWLTFGTKINDWTYSLSTIDMTSSNQTVRTGIGRIVIQAGPVTVFALGDMGMDSGNGNVGSAFSGGAVAAFDLSKLAKTPGAFAVIVVKELKTALNGSQSVFSFGFGKSF